MKKMAVFLLLPLLLWGCAGSKAPIEPMCRVVTRTQVVATVDGQTVDVTHTDSDKMESVLCYLRLLTQGKRVSLDPDSFRSDSYEITLFYSDGQHTTYRQLHTDYLQIDDGPWREIESVKMELLFP